MTAYYNEIDEKAAAWLRELIRRGLIAPGDVDTRSISDVRPDDLRGYTQCHFFAGIGVWSYALRRAGWPDDRPVWTGSCPCQPFSAAGKGAGFADERHLWPHWFWLIGECRPDVIFGEQVASKDGFIWLDLVSADLEGADYAIGAVDTCAAGFGAPHIRQRDYWVAERLGVAAGARSQGLQDRSGHVHGSSRTPAERTGGEPVGSMARLGLADAQLPGAARQRRDGGASPTTRGLWDGPTDSGGPFGVADAAEPGRLTWGRDAGSGDGRGTARVEPGRLFDAGGVADADGAGSRPGERDDPRTRHGSAAAAAGGPGWLADPDGGDAGPERQQRSGEQRQQPQDGGDGLADHRPGPTNGFWADADWLFCRDGKWRPVEPGTFPLAHGAPARVVRLRGYGNAINAAQAQGFIEAYLETKGLVIDGTAGHFRLTELSDLTNDSDIFS